MNRRLSKLGFDTRSLRPRRGVAGFDRMPKWALVLALYLASRVASTVFLGGAFLIATANQWEFRSYRAEPDFFTFSGSWDASFYKRIAEDGYPTELPRDDAGHVTPNPWAFLPLFPFVVKCVIAVAGGEFYPTAVIVATIFGGAATLLLYLLLRERVTEGQAVWGAIFFCYGPLGFMLQVAYAESMMLALTFACLIMLVRRRYLAIIPIGILAAVARPGVLAIALALGVHLIIRWCSREALPLREKVSIIAAGLLIAAAGLAWPIISAVATGEPTAYLDTELAWWVGLVGRQHFAPMTPWFVMATTFLGPLGIALVLVVAGCAVIMLVQPSIRRLGHEIVVFSASYCLYLFAVFLPQQSIFRLLMPMAPLLGSSSLSSSARRRWLIFGVGLGLQPGAIVFLWFLGFP